MMDLAIVLDNRPGALAEMGEALGRAGVSVERGAFRSQRSGRRSLLFEDGAVARNALEAAGSTFWKYATSRYAIEPD